MSAESPSVLESHMRSRALLIFALALFIAGCVIVPEIYHVIRSPHTLEKVEGVRPRLFVQYRPNDYKNRLIQLNLPGGRAHMDVGGALAASYREAFGAFFSLRPDLKYATYVAVVNMDRLELGVEYSIDEAAGRAAMKAGMKHRIPVALIFDGSVEEWVEVGLSVERTVPYASDEALAAETVALVQEMFKEAEGAVLKHLKATDLEGKYLIE
jgi:hypothetical protein